MLQVIVAAALIVAAVMVQYVVRWPQGVVVALCAGSLAFTGFPIVWGALRGLARGKTNVDELVSIAIVASILLGEWISAAIVALIMVLGCLIEEYTGARARRHIERLLASSPDGALVLGDDGRVSRVPVAELRPGQRILARPGDVIAADGTIEEGESSLDESMLTGESVPVDKVAGDGVSAGTINGPGSLKIRVARVGAESTQGKIIQLVQEADRHRAPILRVAEGYAKLFTPTILAIAAAVWWVTGDPFRAVTVLIVGCPCSFVLATPTAVIAAIGRASRQGVLIKGGKYLEASAKVDVLAFDKTGTLTTGSCRINEVTPLDGMAAEELLFHAARLEAGAEHPLARAIVARAREAGLDVTAPASIRREGGLGVSELAEEAGWSIGNERLMERRGVQITPAAHAAAEEVRRRGEAVLFLAEGENLRGILAVEDELRAEAGQALDDLRQAGYRDIYMLTGDAHSIAQRVGTALAIERQRILAGLLPEEKYRHLEAMEAGGNRVCYVGDGTNDGPALALASVGVSIGSRENTVALETAAIILMRDGLAGLPFFLRLGKATTRTIYQNIFVFGLLLNVVMLGLSATGILTPILGAVGHNIGSVAVVLNSARLLRL